MAVISTFFIFYYFRRNFLLDLLFGSAWNDTNQIITFSFRNGNLTFLITLQLTFYGCVKIALIIPNTAHFATFQSLRYYYILSYNTQSTYVAITTCPTVFLQNHKCAIKYEHLQLHVKNTLWRKRVQMVIFVKFSFNNVLRMCFFALFIVSPSLYA